MYVTGLQTGLGGLLASPVGLLAALVAVALAILILRMLLKMAWRLAIMAAVVIGGLYVLGVLGYNVGVF